MLRTHALAGYRERQVVCCWFRREQGHPAQKRGSTTIVKDPPTIFSVVLMMRLSPTRASVDQDGWTVDVGGGTSPTTGDISSRLTTVGNVDLRAGNEFKDAFGLFGDLANHGLGVTNEVLQTLQVPDGNAQLLSLTVGPRWRFPIGGMVDGYVFDGVGWYRRTVEFTQPTVGVIDVIDP
jgi:hypothetical protein